MLQLEGTGWGHGVGLSQWGAEYLARTGNLNSALQLYVGAASDEDNVYFGKVMTEKQRLMRVIGKTS